MTDLIVDSLRLRGRQIDLRDWQVADLDAYAYWLQPGRRWKELDGPYYPGPNEAQIVATITALRTEIEHTAWPEPRHRLIIAAAATNTLLGCVTWYWESVETQWLSVGISIFDPAAWGRGYGYEALGLWSEYLLETMPRLARLDLRTWSGNTGMMRLAEKLGYQQEARFRKARIVRGAYYDGMGYGVLREEWVARYPAGFAAHLVTASNG